MAVPNIPLHLLLLIHLHLLRCPHVDNSEYNQDLFNSQVRGIRERSKAMEDVCYFLVGKVERSSQAAKRVGVLVFLHSRLKADMAVWRK